MVWHLGYIQQLTEELGDPKNLLTRALSPCGQPVCDDLYTNAKNIFARTAIQSSCLNLDSLIDRAHKNISRKVTGPLLLGWIRFYADACILRSLADIGSLTAVEAIERLDGVLITCGIAGGRIDLILLIIKSIQGSYLHHTPSTPDFTCLTSVVSSSPRKHLQSSFSGISALPVPPSLLSFQSILYLKPFIVRRFAKDWPALAERPWRSAAYLRSVSGPGRIVPVEIGNDYRVDDWKQELMKWDDFLSMLDLLDQKPPPNSKQNVYLAQHNLLLQFPALRADISVPDYVYASIDPTKAPCYKPPENKEQLLINVWLGPKGTISPAHTDPYRNFFVQTVGQKTVWLAPSELSTFMYPCSPTHNSSRPQFDGTQTNSVEFGISNTSRVDVFAARTIDFPDFWNKVVPKAMSSVLEPGDLLYIPPGWWHAMRSEETSFSVSMWF